MPTVKVATIQHAFAFRINDGIVVGAVEFIFDGVAQPRRRVCQNTDHVGRATHRITVLQTLSVAVPLIARQVLTQPARHALQAWMRLH